VPSNKEQSAGKKILRVLLVDRPGERKDLIANRLKQDPDSYVIALSENLIEAAVQSKLFKPTLVLAPLTLEDGPVSELPHVMDDGDEIPVLLLAEPREMRQAQDLISDTIVDYLIVHDGYLQELEYVMRRAHRLFRLEKNIPAREMALWESLRKKETLLKEIYHRVKNNFQTVCSILSLQSQHISDERMRAMFQQCQDRVRAMALIHERLYQSENLITIDLQTYMEDLIQGLFWSYSIDPRRISYTVDIQEVEFDLETYIVCGLIVNELVSNSLKYAFPPEHVGRCLIRVELKTDKFDNYNLMVGDTGVGLPVGVDVDYPDSLGLQLVTIFARDQLNGKLEISREGGTVYTINFPHKSKLPQILTQK